MKFASLISISAFLFLMLPLSHTDADTTSGDTEDYLQPRISDNRPLMIGDITVNQTQVPKNGKIEASFSLQGTYDNAFDPDEIDVTGEISAPGKKVYMQPAFFYQNYTRSLESRGETFKLAGNAEWRLRFAPVTTGRYTLVIRAKDKTEATVNSKQINFRCVKSNSKGYVRISKKDKRYFAFDNGNPYFAMGANICWGSAKGTFDFDTWLAKYGASGCNYFRVWLGPGWPTFGLETPGKPTERYGAGKINLVNAWRLDYVLDQANRYGLYMMLCIDSFNTLRMKVDGSYPYWEESPLNKANGGPIDKPIDFWTDPSMMKMYRNKLRYLAARYGWSTNVMSWEFWNEVDIVSLSAFDNKLVTDWHAKMSDYLRGIDIWKHLQTTSFAHSPGISAIHKLPQMDYTQTHNYGSVDMASAMNKWQRQHEIYGKPHYAGEFGADAGGSDSSIDPEGIAFHNGIWSSVFSGGAGTAMSWWWDNHIEPHNLYTHFAALGKFVKGIDFDSEDFRHIDNAILKFKTPTSEGSYRELLLQGPTSWDPSQANKPTYIDISHDGEVNIKDEVSGVLHGTVNHPDLHNPLHIKTELPHQTRLCISVKGVSGYGGAHLIVSLDGKQVIDKDMPDYDGSANGETIHQYDGIYEVEIPAGKHLVIVEDTGNDWIISNYTIEKAIRLKSPDLRIYGLKGKSRSILWIKNSQNTWNRVKVLKKPVEIQPDTILHIPDWLEGKYKIQYWDTYTGKQTSSRIVNVKKDLILDISPIEKDIALRIEKL